MIVDVTVRLVVSLVEGHMLQAFTAGLALEAVGMPPLAHGRHDPASDGQVAAAADHLRGESNGRD